MDFLIIATGYNCQQYVGKCIKMLTVQSYPNWKAVLYDDGSDARIEWPNYKDPRISFGHGIPNMGAAFCRWMLIKQHAKDPETVIVLLGLDDELFPDALERIKEEYDAGKWMTYGNWITPEGYMLPEGFLNYGNDIHRDRSYRKDTYRATAVNTFKRFLFDQLTEEDFKVDGKWIKATTESNLMFSCLEMCGKDKIGVIHEPIYLYNKGRRDNARSRFGDAYQDGIYREMINRPKKELL